jgi:hypothetical protein
MYAYACAYMCSVCICMYICTSKRGIMIIVVGYQTCQLRLYRRVRVEKKKKKKRKTVLYFLWLEVRGKNREREREGAVDKHLFSSISCNTVYIINLQTRWMIQQPWMATTVTGSQFMQYGNKRKRKIEVC